MNDNLNNSQFNQRVFASDEDHPDHVTPLKSPWVPNIKGHQNLKWHVMDHHMKYSYDPSKVSEEYGKGWAKSSIRPNGMSWEDYHQHLHETEHFEWGKTHNHFEPKGKK